MACSRTLYLFTFTKNYYYYYYYYYDKELNYLFSQVIKLLRLIGTTSLPFSALDSFIMLYRTLVRLKVEYASVRNSLTTTDSNKRERIQKKFAALYHNRFF
jgi:hypothetical protein